MAREAPGGGRLRDARVIARYQRAHSLAAVDYRQSADDDVRFDGTKLTPAH